MKFSLPKLSIPMFSPRARAGGKATAALVIRATDVELLRMEGRQVAGQLRVPIEGQDEAHLAQAIRKALESAHLSTRRLAVAIPPQDVLIRFFTMPIIPKSEWEAAVQFEARKYVPFKIESLIWDSCVMPPAADRSGDAPGQELEVVFAGIPREAFNRLQAALASAGVHPTVIEPLSLSLARLVDASKDQARHAFACVVDIHQSWAHLVIARNGIPYLTRDIHFVGLSPAGSSDGPGLDASQPIQRLLSELRVSMDFFRREHPAAAIASVVLFGDEPLIAPWVPQLAAHLSCPVTLGARLLQEHADAGLPLSSAPALGLLLSNGSGGQMSLDFLAHSKMAVPSPARTFAGAAATAGLKELLTTPQTIATAAIIGASLTAALWVSGQVEASKEQHRLEQLMRSRAPAAKELEAMDQAALKPIQEQAGEQLKLLKEVMDRRLEVAAKLDALARSLPEGVWLTGLTFEHRLDMGGKGQKTAPHLVVNGACFLGSGEQELSAIQEFEARVKRSPVLLGGSGTAQLGQVSAATTPQQESSYRTFQLNCQPSGRL